MSCVRAGLGGAGQRSRGIGRGMSANRFHTFAHWPCARAELPGGGDLAVGTRVEPEVATCTAARTRSTRVESSVRLEAVRVVEPPQEAADYGSGFTSSRRSLRRAPASQAGRSARRAAGRGRGAARLLVSGSSAMRKAEPSLTDWSGAHGPTSHGCSGARTTGCGTAARRSAPAPAGRCRQPAAHCGRHQAGRRSAVPSGSPASIVRATTHRIQYAGPRRALRLVLTERDDRQALRDPTDNRRPLRCSRRSTAARPERTRTFGS